MTRFRQVAGAVAWRSIHKVATTPMLLVPSIVFPMFFFVAFAGGLSRVNDVPGFQFPVGYTAFQFVFVLMQSAAFAGVFTGFGIVRDFETGFARRLMVAAPDRRGRGTFAGERDETGVSQRRACAGAAEPRREPRRFRRGCGHPARRSRDRAHPLRDPRHPHRCQPAGAGRRRRGDGHRRQAHDVPRDGGRHRGRGGRGAQQSPAPKPHEAAAPPGRRGLRRRPRRRSRSA